MRKPRTTGRRMKLDGLYHINDRPFDFRSIAQTKIYNRIKENKCPACGKETCECKKG